MTWIIVIGILAAALAGGGGVAYASNDALPGDALYPVKTAIQDVELAFASDEAELGLRLTQLDINIDELEELEEEGRLDDMEEGVEEYVENFQQFLKLRERVSYEDAGTEDSINQRLQTQYQDLINLEEGVDEATEEGAQLKAQIRNCIQLTETGKIYGPQAAGEQSSGTGEGKPEGAGDGTGMGTNQNGEDNGQNGNNGNNGDGNNGGGSGDGNNGGQGGNGGGNGSGTNSGNLVLLDEKGCQITEEGELCAPEIVGYACTENGQGELSCTQEHPEYGYGAYLCEWMGGEEDAIMCKPEMPRDGHFGPAGPGNGNGGDENNKP